MFNTQFVCATSLQVMNFVSVQNEKNTWTVRRLGSTFLRLSEGIKCDMPDILYMLDQLFDSLLPTMEPKKAVGSRNDLHGRTPQQSVACYAIRVGEAQK